MKHKKSHQNCGRITILFITVYGNISKKYKLKNNMAKYQTILVH